MSRVLPHAGCMDAPGKEQSLCLSLSQGRLRLEMRVFCLGRDMHVLLSGGEAHLGVVALAAPDSGGKEAGNGWAHVLTLPGHREDQLALRMARRLARELDRVVCVSAGIHYPDISREEIAGVETLAEALTQALIRRCLTDLPTPNEDTPC